MFKSLIAAAVLSTAVIGVAAQAEAKTKVDFNVVIGGGEFYDGGAYYDRPVYPVFDGHSRPHPRPHYSRPRAVEFDDGVSCRGGARILRQNGFNGIEAFDCSAPVYGYTAWRGSRMFNVKVNLDGDIISARRVRR